MACARNRPPDGVDPNDPRVAVPAASARVEANTADEGWASRLRTQAVCLIRTADAEGCRGGEDPAPACDARSPAEVNATLETLFQALPRITLASPFTASDSVHVLLPTALVTRAVDDARRSSSCNDWQNGPPCVAVRIAGVWAVLYRSEPAPGPVQHVEILLANAQCRSDLSP
jgi:hypothetical protein